MWAADRTREPDATEVPECQVLVADRGMAGVLVLAIDGANRRLLWRGWLCSGWYWVEDELEKTDREDPRRDIEERSWLLIELTL